MQSSLHLALDAEQIIPGNFTRVAKNVKDSQQARAGTRPHEHGQLTKDVEALDSLVQRGSHVQNFAFYGLLKRCIAEKDLALGSRVHALVVKAGYESSAFLANHLICMYAAHRKLEEATKVFSKVSTPTRQMWASMILAHARHGDPAQAMTLYRQMRSSCLQPDSRIFVAALRACAAAEDILFGRELHADIMRSGGGVQDDVFVGNSLVNMYAKCGALDDAREVFESLAKRDVVTWNAMIAGYARAGLGQEALALYERMQQQDGGGVRELSDPVTFVCLLTACASSKSLHHGRMLHTHIQERGLGANVVVNNCLVTMYANCGSLEDARKVFDGMPTKSVVTWTAMIGGYAQHGRGQDSLALYAKMQQEGLVPANRVTFVCLLQACASAQAVQEGKQLHAQIQERGMEADVVIGTCLVDMYSKCGSMTEARRVFDGLSSRNMVTWTAMIVGYAQRGLGEEARSLLASMLQQEGVTPADAVSFSCLLQACGSIGALQQGRQLHALARARGLEDDLVVGTCLVDMYAKCGSMDEARRVFDGMPSKDVVTWTAMLAGYAQEGMGVEALGLYARMQSEGVDVAADTAAYVCLLQACGSVAGLEKGREIHAQLGLEPAGELVVSNALIDMYSKCGSMADAQQVFDALPSRDIVTWSALMAGYARQGHKVAVFDIFRSMEREGVQPNAVTFLSLLTACSHAGLVEEGHTYFEKMTRDHGITPTMEHYSAMVDLLGRAGRLREAMALVKAMPVEATSEVWRCLLCACRNWRDAELGREAFECAVMLDRDDPAAYILMANIYGSAGMPEEARDVQVMRASAQAWKRQGHSCWTDGAGIVHTFAVGDAGHGGGGQNLYGNLEGVYAKFKELEEEEEC